jgi:hypothetical protein
MTLHRNPLFGSFRRKAPMQLRGCPDDEGAAVTAFRQWCGRCFATDLHIRDMLADRSLDIGDGL